MREAIRQRCRHLGPLGDACVMREAIRRILRCGEAITSAHSVMHAWQTRCPHGASCTSAACSVRQIGHASRAPGGTLTSAAAF